MNRCYLEQEYICFIHVCVYKPTIYLHSYIHKEILVCISCAVNINLLWFLAPLHKAEASGKVDPSNIHLIIPEFEVCTISHPCIQYSILQSHLLTATCTSLRRTLCLTGLSHLTTIVCSESGSFTLNDSATVVVAQGCMLWMCNSGIIVELGIFGSPSSSSLGVITGQPVIAVVLPPSVKVGVAFPK